MKKIGFFVFIVFLYTNTGISQVLPLMPKYYQPLDSSVIAKNEKKDPNKILIKKHEKISYSVALGTGFSSFGNNISMMSSYISPSVNYKMNSKLDFTVNGIIMQNNLNGVENLNTMSPVNQANSNVSNYGISTIIHYQLSNKWSIWGDGAYLENQSVFNDYRSDVYDTDYKTVSLGVGYKVNEKLQFNIQYRYSNGLHPGYNSFSPYYNSINNPLHSHYGIWDY